MGRGENQVELHLGFVYDCRPPRFGTTTDESSARTPALADSPLLSSLGTLAGTRQADCHAALPRCRLPRRRCRRPTSS